MDLNWKLKFVWGMGASNRAHGRNWELYILMPDHSVFWPWIWTHHPTNKHDVPSASPWIHPIVLRLHNSLCKQHIWCEDLVISEHVWCVWSSMCRPNSESLSAAGAAAATTMKGSINKQLPNSLMHQLVSWICHLTDGSMHCSQARVQNWKLEASETHAVPSSSPDASEATLRCECFTDAVTGLTHLQPLSITAWMLSHYSKLWICIAYVTLSKVAGRCF